MVKPKQQQIIIVPFFANSRIIIDSAIAMNFELNGKYFMALNGGKELKFNEAVSFVIPCKNQEEIDYYWNNFIADGGEEGKCGWCKDKFGLSWQIVPTILNELMMNPEKAQRVLQVFLKMKKFEIEKLIDL